ncbi:MAG: endonuclease III [Candidatus Cloacimonadota bacterium]|nr:MAG: endonuclease III [Candidatus Cloacimonadota bacterium]PIE78471.1 MAG: endonuclease III [Candidatus Delongbacteria bacterium]
MSTILSLRTKDEVTSKASTKLFQKAPNVETLSKLDPKTVEKLIYPVGFYKRKAEQLITISQQILDNYNGKIPNKLEDLLKFKGVGRKTANLVLALGYNIPAICVDTHVHRISNRWGFVETKTPEKTEFALMEKLDIKFWNRINDLMVAFGQTICRPIGPKCGICPLSYCKEGKKL